METLEKFLNRNNNPEGHYAVWMSSMFNSSDDARSQGISERLYGFSGAVVEYRNHEGFKNYPDWFEDADEKEVKIILLEEYPESDMFW